MRRSLSTSVTFFIAWIAFSLVLRVPNVSAASASSWTVVNQPVHLVNGSPVLFRVNPPMPVRALSATWLGHDIEFSFDVKHKSWFALAGVALETKPGTYSLEVHGESSSAQSAASSSGQPISFEKKFRVGRRRYPRVLLKVPARYTAPSADEQRQIEADKKTKTEAFKTLSTAREWQGAFDPPVNATISDVFGVERVFNGSVESTHQGLDFRVSTGTSVEAVNNGRIILARPLFFEGNCIVIDHGQGLLTLYLHLSKFLVSEGDDVKRGEPIGLSGGTGRATGPHLHLAVRWQGVYLNPQTLLKLNLP
jgi:murein DD-endopeptidase MepM/ murein hydrolase activator NlpD